MGHLRCRQLRQGNRAGRDAFPESVAESHLGDCLAGYSRRWLQDRRGESAQAALGFSPMHRSCRIKHRSKTGSAASVRAAHGRLVYADRRIQFPGYPPGKPAGPVRPISATAERHRARLLRHVPDRGSLGPFSDREASRQALLGNHAKNSRRRSTSAAGGRDTSPRRMPCASPRWCGGSSTNRMPARGA